MRKEEYIREVVSRIKNKKAKAEVEKELSNHIDDRISYYTDAGWDEATATEKAMEHMGEAESVAEKMGKIHNKKLGLFLKLVLSVVLIDALLVVAPRIYFYLQPVDSFIKEGTEAYTPSGIPVKHHIDFFSIDTYEYWVYKLNDSQCEEIDADIQEGNWEKMSPLQYNRFPFNYKEIFRKDINFSDCYIIVYDAHGERLITGNSRNIMDITSNWVIIIYDNANSYYYCIHQSC